MSKDLSNFNAEDARKLAQKVNQHLSYDEILQKALESIELRAVGGHKNAIFIVPDTIENKETTRRVILELNSRGFSLEENNPNVIGDEIWVGIRF